MAGREGVVTRKVFGTFRFEPDAMDRLRKVAARYRVPQAAIVREGVDLALDLWERRNGAGAPRRAGECTICGETGHNRRTCTFTPQPGTTRLLDDGGGG